MSVAAAIHLPGRILLGADTRATYDGLCPFTKGKIAAHGDVSYALTGSGVAFAKAKLRVHGLASSPAAVSVAEALAGPDVEALVTDGIALYEVLGDAVHFVELGRFVAVGAGWQGCVGAWLATEDDHQIADDYEVRMRMVLTVACAMYTSCGLPVEVVTVRGPA